MRGVLSGVAGLVLALSASAVVAEPQSETLFQHKHWEVEIVGFDDGTVACLAEVDAQTDSFSIWVYQDQSIRLQFYSTSWEFGEGDTADLEVQIGKRSPWSFTNAELYKNSILFNLPDSEDGVNFLVEVAQGSRLFLRTAQGEPVMDYSLAGSRASIDALIACSDVLNSSDPNPFD